MKPICVSPESPIPVIRKEPLVAHCRMTNANVIIHKGPCLVVGITISADGVNADCDVYDGENANEERKFHLEALAGTTFGAQLWEGTDFDKGIYVVVNAATTFVTIQYIPESMHKFY